MGVAAGSRLGPYEIQSLIGAGGMGEVYKAKDTRLEREAKAIAGLNHPNICTLHAVGDQCGSLFLVMEHRAAGQVINRCL
jgi:serine/threonine protein kinase